MLTIDFAEAGISPGQRVLDLGCGGGRHAFGCLKLGADVIAVDTDLEEVRSVISTVVAMRQASEIGMVIGAGIVADTGRLPIRDDAFDRVIASEVLEHLSDDTRALEELIRVLAPGGLFALSVPRNVPERVNWALSREYHEIEGGHVRIYRRRDLIKKCEGLGLRVVAGHYAHGLHTPYWWLRCAVGVSKADHWLVAAYHRVLVWDIVVRPRSMRFAERLLNPLVGKSLVLYFQKPR